MTAFVKISNDIDEALAQILDPPSHAISMSIGTASFIQSMDQPEDGSHASTVLEVPTASELEEIARLVIIYFEELIRVNILFLQDDIV